MLETSETYFQLRNELKFMVKLNSTNEMTYFRTGQGREQLSNQGNKNKVHYKIIKYNLDRTLNFSYIYYPQ